MAKGNYGVTALGGLGGSGAGGNSSGKPGANGKPMRGQIEPIINVTTSWEAHDLSKSQVNQINRYAVKMIQEETGMSKSEAEKADKAMIDYFGGDYKAYKSGQKTNFIDKIDSTLSRMSAYDGTIYRGMSFLNHSDYDNFIREVQTSGVYSGNGSVTSWTSEEITGDYFASFAFSTNSVKIICRNNSAAVGVQHISKFGKAESEVLAPSQVQWKVDKITTTNSGKFRKTVIEVSQEKYSYQKKKK